jgi:hypothetical protein
MKKITVLITALAVALPVLAQQPAKPAAAPAKPAPVQEPAKAEAPKPATMAEAPKAPKKHTPSRRTEDARQCLEKGSNTDIIKCAEEYL